MKDHISVCICTYKRPELIKFLLATLEKQRVDSSFSFSVIVVDNDPDRSAQSVVGEYAKELKISITYLTENENNISLARNRAVKNSQGNLIAFIDDDEFPSDDWLFHMTQALKKYKCSGVLGPVRPHYPEGIPQWIIKGKICEREEYETGTKLHWLTTRTGNVLLYKEVFDEGRNVFGYQAGITGGGDIVFFKECMDKGHIFKWCNEAPVYEWVIKERWKRSYYLRRRIRVGGLAGKQSRKKFTTNVKYILLSIAGLVLNLILLPVGLFRGHHIFMNYLEKVCYHFARLLGCFGLVILKTKKFA